MQSFFLFLFTAFSGNGLNQNAQNSYTGLCIFGLHGLDFVFLYCLCSLFISFVNSFIHVCLFWSSSVKHNISSFRIFSIFIISPQTENLTGDISVKWITVTLLHLFRCQSWRMGYIPALQEPGTFIWKIQMMCKQPFSCIMCCVYLMHHSLVVFDRYSQIFRKFVGKLKQRLNAVQVTTRWKESFDGNSVLP